MAEHLACPLPVNESIVLTSSGLCFNDSNLDVIVDLHHFFPLQNPPSVRLSCHKLQRVD